MLQKLKNLENLEQDVLKQINLAKESGEQDLLNLKKLYHQKTADLKSEVRQKKEEMKKNLWDKLEDEKKSIAKEAESKISEITSSNIDTSGLLKKIASTFLK